MFTAVQYNFVSCVQLAALEKQTENGHTLIKQQRFHYDHMSAHIKLVHGCDADISSTALAWLDDVIGHPPSQHHSHVPAW